MQVRVFHVLVLLDMGTVVNQVLGDSEEALNVVELKAGIQQICSIFDAIFLIPEEEPGVKVEEFDHEETIEEHDIPQIIQTKFQSTRSDVSAQSRRFPSVIFAVDGAEDGFDCERVVFVKVDDAFAGLGELAGRQEFLEDC